MNKKNKFIGGVGFLYCATWLVATIGACSIQMVKHVSKKIKER